VLCVSVVVCVCYTCACVRVHEYCGINLCCFRILSGYSIHFPCPSFRGGFASVPQSPVAFGNTMPVMPDLALSDSFKLAPMSARGPKLSSALSARGDSPPLPFQPCLLTEASKATAAMHLEVKPFFFPFTFL
jgi:hypothetical protein